MSTAVTIDAAVSALHSGQLIAYPTEAVWGLGCDPDNDRALTALLRLKQRDPAKGLILVAADIAQLAPWLEGLPAEYHAPLVSSWPGPNTWLVPDNGRSHALVRGCHRSVALRVSDHPLVARLCMAYGGPIVSTSANHAGDAPALTAGQVRERFGAEVAAVVEGPLGGYDHPSTIRDLVSGHIVRA
ncbi:L-threonylcarbamoyladenylate synthase [Aidingimonas halophila]|uniref:Threonylcarbamoyl-AMP synthase n=1 Tax=Aidingimonas halophila TaxID=574349 RepID=A0A1H2ZLF3_9GAMM|nr:Sua5/YciO/YrdC/YwlC family protein [Aidingimonas halophila]GHC16288.1 threonylcarbamoyl-AMP synthase [Aidingimonas halophila]SDX18280.1 translation factor SUA5 [Aidingimonas halophila]